MGHQFIRQPNGKWAIWSTVVDDFVWLECEERDLFSAEAWDQLQREYRSIKNHLDRLENGPRMAHWMDWEEALHLRREVHKGEESFKEDPLEDCLPPDVQEIANIDDFLRTEFMQLAEFYWWHKERIASGECVDPPFQIEEAGTAEVRGRWTKEHYEHLLGLFKQGKLTNPLCPRCKEIVEEEGQTCDKCKERY